MKKKNDIKNNNSFLITCISCILVLLVMCYFGFNATIKGTAAITSGSYVCKTGNSPVDFSDGKGCIDYNFQIKEMATGWQCQTTVYVMESDVEKLESEGYICADPTTTPLGNKAWFCFYEAKSKTIADLPCVSKAPQGYNIIYNLDGGSNGPTNTIKYSDEPYRINGMEPTKKDNIFKGWSGSNGKMYKAGDLYSTNADLTLIAIWEPVIPDTHTVTVTFNPNGGTVNGNSSLSCDAPLAESCTVTGLPSATKNGFIFRGWSMTTACTTSTNSSITTSQDITYYACYEEEVVYPTITVTFDPNGGTLTGSSSLSCTQYTDACTITGLPSASRTSSVFKGWGLDMNCTSGATSHLSVNKNMTYYACYVPSTVTPVSKTFTVTFKANGGTLNGSSTASCTTTTGSCTISGSKFPTATRDGYVFNGWDDYNTCQNGYGSTGVITLTGDAEFYACYVKEVEKPVTPTSKTFTATFDANGGTLNGSKTLSCNTTTDSCNVAGLPTASKKDATFKGWGDSASCTSGKTGSLTINSNKKFYACYVKASGSVSDNENVTENPKTSEIAIAFVWFFGLLAVGYSFYYFRNVKEN